MGGEDTIFALSSGAGMAGVAVVRVSGPLAAAAINRFSGKEPPAPRRAVLRLLRDTADGELIDEALILWMPGPGSFTGEDVAEFHVHGGRATVRRLLAALSGMEGLRMAKAGEFTRRAFDNGRMTLMDVEGLADLLRAETESQRRQALEAASGAAALRAGKWRDDLIFILSRLEAAIDFIEEEDVAAQALEGLAGRMDDLTASMDAALREARVAERIREGLRIVLAGPPNAGKSSLLNAMARRDVAIVSQTAGTTRDVLEVHMDLDGLPVILCDTAGLRDETGDGDEIEKIGQARARDLLKTADAVIWMEAPDARSNEIPHFESDALRILNKSDLADSVPLSSRYDLCVSVKTGEGLKDLEERLTGMVHDRYDLVRPPVITRERQRQALDQARERLSEARAALDGPVEVTAELARQAARDLERLIGKVDVEDLLDSIFSSFCIGK